MGRVPALVLLAPTRSFALGVDVKLAVLFVKKFRQEVLTRHLVSHGMDVLPAQNVTELVQLLKRPDIDGALLEDDPTQLVDWLAVLHIRTAGALPVIVVGDGRAERMEEALRNGATDYIDLDDPAEQLHARLSARLRSWQSATAQNLEVGPYDLCAVRRSIANGGSEINLTAREFAIAWALFSNAGRVVSASSLSAHVWGRSGAVSRRTLEQHVYKLRRKLAAAPSAESLRIQAFNGIGYRLDLIDGRGADSRPALFDVSSPA